MIYKQHQLSNFANTSTTTKGKLTSTRQRNDTIRHIFQSNKVYKNGKALVLVGSGRQLARHVRELTDLGFALKDIIVVEWQESTYKSLLKAASKFKGVKVLHGELISMVHHLCQAGMKINYIDADGVLPWGQFDLDLYKIAKKYQIPVVTINGYLKTKPSIEFQTKFKELRLRKRYCKKNDRVSWKQGLTIPIIMQKVLKYHSHSADWHVYHGKGPMYITNLIRKDLQHAV